MIKEIETYVKAYSESEIDKEINEKIRLGFIPGEHFLVYKRYSVYTLINFRKQFDKTYICYHKSSTAISTMITIKNALKTESRFIKTRVDKDNTLFTKMIIENPYLVDDKTELVKL